MDTDEEPSGLSISSETETGHVGGGATCIVVGLISQNMFFATVKDQYDSFDALYRKNIV
jgi:hypothetical protein